MIRPERGSLKVSWLGAVGLLAVVVLPSGLSGEPAETREEVSVPSTIDFTVARPWEKASVGGKYQTLLREIKVPEDLRQYSYFRDYGYYEGATYAGYTGLPKGYWVYVYPCWYIWRDCTEKP